MLKGCLSHEVYKYRKFVCERKVLQSTVLVIILAVTRENHGYVSYFAKSTYGFSSVGLSVCLFVDNITQKVLNLLDK